MINMLKIKRRKDIDFQHQLTEKQKKMKKLKEKVQKII